MVLNRVEVTGCFGSCMRKDGKAKQKSHGHCIDAEAGPDVGEKAVKGEVQVWGPRSDQWGCHCLKGAHC